MAFLSAKSIKTTYLRILDYLHKPFHKKGEFDPYHEQFREFLDLSRQITSPHVLEIGSRNVSGLLRRDWFPHCKEYTGFDVHAGEGVDIVGDAHKLSQYLPKDHYDIVFSISVFEHLLFPWKAILEINEVVKTGGYVFYPLIRSGLPMNYPGISGVILPMVFTLCLTSIRDLKLLLSPKACPVEPIHWWMTHPPGVSVSKPCTLVLLLSARKPQLTEKTC